MIRRWCIPLTTIALVFGSLMAAAGGANAAVTAHPGITHVRPGGAVHAFKPGGLMQRPTGALARAHGIKNQAESTNWSGYAVTGANGAFHSVSASWTEPTATCTSRRRHPVRGLLGRAGRLQQRLGRADRDRLRL